MVNKVTSTLGRNAKNTSFVFFVTFVVEIVGSIGGKVSGNSYARTRRTFHNRSDKE